VGQEKNEMPKKLKVGSAHCTMALNATGEGPLRNIPLLPAPQPDGTVPGRDGRYWKFNNGEAVVAASRAYQKQYGAPLDEGHKMFFSPDAPAFGWFQDYTLTAEGGLDGTNELNNLGLAAIDNKHYRYASVVFDYDLETLEILVIKGAGLTNNQNLQVQALNSKLPAGAGANKEDGMLKAILMALNLKEDATQDQALNRIQELTTAQTALNARGETVPKQQLIDATTALNTAQGELKTLKEAGFKEKVTAALNKASTDGKLTPAARAKWEPSITDDTALNHFTSIMETMPVLTKDQIPAGEAPAGGTALNSATVEMGKAFGNSEEDLKKYGN
jgi:phage I-like protein